MPELAEVEITRLKLLPLVKGRRILGFWTDWPRGLRTATGKQRAASSMRGRKIIDLRRRGKVLFFKLSGEPLRVMAIHLRMSGRLEVTHWPPAEPELPMRHPEPPDGTSGGKGSPEILRRLRRLRMTSEALPRWTHFTWRLSGRPPSGRTSPSAGDIELHFIDPRKFGTVWYGSESGLKRDKYLARLGRDARSISYPLFADALRKKSGMVKAILLRQDVFSGIGNIIADESLWQAQIHPQARIAALGKPAIKRLHQALAKTISAMLSSGGTSLRDWGHPDGKKGGYQKQRKIYGKAGEPCPRCKTKLERLVVAGRGTTVCPECQKFSTEAQNSKLK